MITAASRATFVSVLALAASATGCGSTQTRPAPASSTTVTSEDLRNRTEPIEVVLQRKVPGLVITRSSDGGIALQIRGASSFDGSDAPPLYVLNGMPIAPGPGGALLGVNLEDIDTIKVLKGAEAGIYGIDGAHGVIVVTTKTAGTRKR